MVSSVGRVEDHARVHDLEASPCSSRTERTPKTSPPDCIRCSSCWWWLCRLEVSVNGVVDVSDFHLQNRNEDGSQRRLNLFALSGTNVVGILEVFLCFNCSAYVYDESSIFTTTGPSLSSKVWYFRAHRGLGSVSAASARDPEKAGVSTFVRTSGRNTFLRSQPPSSQLSSRSVSSLDRISHDTFPISLSQEIEGYHDLFGAVGVGGVDPSVDGQVEHW